MVPSEMEKPDAGSSCSGVMASASGGSSPGATPPSAVGAGAHGVTISLHVIRQVYRGWPLAKLIETHNQIAAGLGVARQITLIDRQAGKSLVLTWAEARALAVGIRQLIDEERRRLSGAGPKAEHMSVQFDDAGEIVGIEKTFEY